MKQIPFPGRLIGGTLLLLCFGLLNAAFKEDLSIDNRPYQVKKYIQKYRYLAVELNQQTNIPIPIIVAIAGLESNWGKSELAQYANNHFGIKANKWWGATYCKNTAEYWGQDLSDSYECFRKYPLIRESYEDFGRFILSRTAYSWLLRPPTADYRLWAQTLEDSNYATDPFYAEKLIRVIEEYRLHEIIRPN
ncbi:MAG: hypothetical protein DHS20C18_38520 [Saprospiraceae bacterium]|nr:MAG: hypothetical protein DHS20C18_38520 [Saprospiraceae bacterium]